MYKPTSPKKTGEVSINQGEILASFWQAERGWRGGTEKAHQGKVRHSPHMGGDPWEEHWSILQNSGEAAVVQKTYPDSGSEVWSPQQGENWKYVLEQLTPPPSL